MNTANDLATDSVTDPAVDSTIPPGAKVLLLGATGAGKTHSLRTLVDVGITPFIIFTEAHGINIVTDIPCPKLHYAYIPPTSGSWNQIINRAKLATSISWNALKEQIIDPDKSQYTGYLDVVTQLFNFKCQRCGENFGDVSTWSIDRAICVDSFSGINTMAMQMFTGESIAKSQPQWGAAMKAELVLSDKLCFDTRAHYVLIAHVERQMDEVYGGTHIVPMCLGRKVAPDLPKNFSDVIHVLRKEKTFTWSTITPNADLKANNVAWSDKLPPSFVPLIESWRKRAGST